MSEVITVRIEDGRAVFSNKVSENGPFTTHAFPVVAGAIDFGDEDVLEHYASLFGIEDAPRFAMGRTWDCVAMDAFEFQKRSPLMIQ